jgi:hypothetical protein
MDFMHYYRYNESIIISQKEIEGLDNITQIEAECSMGKVYVINPMEPSCSRRSFCISSSDLISLKKEDASLLDYPREVYPGPDLWLKDKILNRQAVSLNSSYPLWKQVLISTLPASWRINIAGMGDVGGTLALGLRLLGGSNVSSIGIYDLDQNKLKRYEYELNQVYSPTHAEDFPNVMILDERNLFECDVFVFCVTAGVPPIGNENEDVRLAQLNANSKIIELYAKMARETGYKGIFAVMSDPVDLLCAHALKASNTSPTGELDYMGMAPEQIRGLGLGVMNARAMYYSSTIPEFSQYAAEGRAFGPHGHGLIIADSIPRYDHENSEKLTIMVENANLKVREIGYKPYIAPALSSGALSIIALITGNWNYSSVFLGGAFIGCRNRLLQSGTELERLKLPQKLFDRIQALWPLLGV